MRTILAWCLLALVLVPFTKDVNFMSLKGFERWQRFQQARQWS